MSKDNSGHDWWHVFRVRKMALEIARHEGGDLLVIEMAALLHDVDDYKLTSHSQNQNVLNWLKSQNLDEKIIGQILTIIEEVSFKGDRVKNPTSSKEAEIVQDADRLDAIGAIGIARAFAYGGSRNRLLFDPEEIPASYHSFEDYKRNKSSTIIHFYEKLLLLKERMNTSYAKKIAQERHQVMLDFLENFFREWNVEI